MGQLRFMCVLIASFSILMLSGVLTGLLGIYGYPSEYVVILAYLLAVIVVMSGLYYRLQNMGKGNIGCILIPIILIISLGLCFYFSGSWLAFCVPSAIFCLFPSGGKEEDKVRK
jgi:hypothetical protein